MVRSEIEVVLRCKNQVQVDALTVVDFTTLLACAAGGTWVGVLYCFGGGAARRVGIQLILKIPCGFATRFARTYSWCASRDSTNQNASFVDWWYIWWNFAFQARVDNFDTISLGKLLEHFILIVVALLFNMLLSWAFATSLNYSVMCKPPWWFDCNFRRTSWIHSWLLVAVLSDYFGQLVTSTFLLCKFRGLPGSSRVFPW